MTKGKNILGIIPARGGSKGVPFKNIKLLNGKPLIYYIIKTAEKAQKEGVIDRFIVSTDSEKIAGISRKLGAEVPFLRPLKYSQDNSPDIEFMKHSVLEMKKLGFKAEIVLNLRPTSIFLTTKDIKNAVDLLIKSGGSSVRSLSPLEHNCHPYWVKKLEGNKVSSFLKGFDEVNYYNRQTLPPLFRLNAAIDVCRAENILKNNLYGSDMRGYVMDGLLTSLDINSEFDFLLAEALIKGKYL